MPGLTFASPTTFSTITPLSGAQITINSNQPAGFQMKKAKRKPDT